MTEENKVRTPDINLFKWILDSTEDAIFSNDLLGNITSWNKAAERVFGYSFEEMINQPVSILFPPYLKNQEQEFIQTVTQHKQIEKFETERVRKNGTIIKVQISVSAIRNTKGDLIGLSKIVHNLQEQKNAQQRITQLDSQLLNSEHKYRAIVDNSNLAIFLSKPDGTILEANTAAAEMFGYTIEEIKNSHRNKLFDVSDTDFIKNFIQQRDLKRKVNEEFIGIKKDGTRFYCEVASSLFNYSDGIQLTSNIITDISARKISEAEIKKHQELFEQAEQLVTLGSVEINVKTGERRWSNGFYKLLGYEPLSIKPSMEVFVSQLIPEYKEPYLKWYNDIIIHKQKTASTQVVIIDALGKRRTFAVNGMSQFDNDGNVCKLIGVIQDISNVITIEQQNKLNQLRYSALFQGAHDAIFIADVATKTIVDLNLKASKLIGYAKEDVIGKDISFIHPAEEMPLISEIFKAFTANNENVKDAECHVLHKNKYKIPVAISAGQVFQIEDKRYSAAYFKDLTIIKETEKKIERMSDLLQRAESLALIGSSEINLITEERVWSNGLYTILGFEPNSILPVNGTFKAMVVPKDKARYEAWFTKTQTTQTQPLEINITRKDGAERMLLLSGKIHFDEDQEPKLTIVTKDITEEKAILLNLENKNEILRNIAWTQSHIVRAPLSRIMGLIDVLKMGLVSKEEEKQFFDYLLTSAHELDEVIKLIIHSAVEKDQ